MRLEQYRNIFRNFDGNKANSQKSHEFLDFVGKTVRSQREYLYSFEASTEADTEVPQSIRTHILDQFDLIADD